MEQVQLTPPRPRLMIARVGTPGGRDLDLNITLPLPCRNLHLAFWGCDFFINYDDAAYVIAAHRFMQARYRTDPALLVRWLDDKALAWSFLIQGLITEADYALFKAEWHRRRGLPDVAYRHKAASVERLSVWPPRLRQALLER